MESKILFSLLARSESEWLNPPHICQEGWMPGFPDCLYWNTIQGARVEKKAMRVTWLDLANDYDRLHHKALDFF